MSIRNLHPALAPKSVAVFGASERPGSLGAAVLNNIRAGNFAGPVWPVNPRHRHVMGLACHARAADLPGVPDLAVIAVPPAHVAGTLAALAARGGRLAVVLSAAPEGGPAALLAPGRPALLRLIGPDSFGLIAPAAHLNASLAAHAADPGPIALVSTSGVIAATLIDWGAERGIGFSHVVGLGAMADVDLGDALDLLAGDGPTRAILVYAESLGVQGVKAARKFLSAARAAARLKPVIALMPVPGATDPGAPDRAAQLVSPDAVLDAAARRAGVLRVRGLAELLDAAETLARFRPMRRARLGVVTNSHAIGVLTETRLADRGLSPASGIADIGAGASPEAYLAALEAKAADRDVDLLLALNGPTGLTDAAAIAEAVAGRTRRGVFAGKPLLACWLGGTAARAARATLREAGIAAYGTPAAAAAAAGHLTDWSAAQDALLRVPDRGADGEGPDLPADARLRTAAVLAAAASDGRDTLTEPESLAVLAAYGIPVSDHRAVTTPAEAEAAAAALLATCRAVAVKLVSRDVTRKSAVGGVVLGLETATAAGAAAATMSARLAAEGRIRIDGFLVEPMADRAEGIELILGITRDPVFGPVILCGAGGRAVELHGDLALALPPLDRGLAADLLAWTRAGRLLASGATAASAAEARALGDALVALSHLVEDNPALRALDVNPLLAGAGGVVALDATLAFDPALLDAPAVGGHLAIRPYPAAWRRDVAIKGGSILVRPIRPQDVALYPAFLGALDETDIRMRFMAPRKHFPDEMGLRLTQLDYDRDMAFVALLPEGDLAGVSRLSCDPDRQWAEYALVVRSDLAGRGIGSVLLGQLIAYARAEGIARLEGMILAENRPMRSLVERIGFTIRPMPEEPGVVMSQFDLTAS